jgi:cell division septation protein DedD
MIEILLQAERALSLGLLDRAETLYRQVAEADPRNSIAVVGLARVALERGDDGASLALGRRALDIDPENSAAQRLVQRLEEVRAYREAGGAAAEAGGAAAEAEPEAVVVPTDPVPADVTTDAAPAPATPPAQEHEPETEPAPAPAMPPEPARSGWRSWLARLFRRG